jgi:hypothetical protein
MAYISTAVEIDPVTLTERKVELLQTRIPGLLVNPGHPLYHLLEASSSVDAENRQYLTDVPALIFQTGGGQLFRVPVRAATQAKGTATLTAVDTNGPYTLPAGTELTLAGAGDERVAFQTVNEVTIPNGQSSTAAGEVELIAVDPGAHGTGLQADAQLEEIFDWVQSFTVVAATTGGVDGEDEGTYRDRLSDKLTLRGDTLVRPVHFEIEARTESPEVHRALALDLYQAARNEVQQVNVANATGGTFPLTFEAQTTAGINHNANAATVQAALEALSNIAPGDVVVTGGPANTAPLEVEFRGALAASDRTEMTTSSASLTGAGASATVSTLTQGQAGVPSTAGTVSVAVIDKNGLDPGLTVRETGQARQQALVESGLSVSWITATYTAITVVFAAKCFPDYDPADVEARAEQAVLDFLSPANWGRPQTGDQRQWLLSATVRYRDVVHAIENVEGLDYTSSVTVNGGTADVALSGAAPLPAAPPSTTVAGTVTLP